MKKAIITSISGTKLTANEKRLFRKHQPWGIILFKRNLKNYNQIKILIKSIKKIFNNSKYPIMIDEEGGSVSRLSDVINTSKFSQSFFGEIYSKNKTVGKKVYEIYINNLSQILRDLGINLNTVPVLDKLYKHTNKVLKNRMYSRECQKIIKLGQTCIKTFQKNKVLCVIKHIPGHGLATSDSHKKLPIVNKNLKFLNSNDFKCFKNNSSHFAMTAHILYKKIDNKNCVTFSKKIINEIIRKKIGFKGILISDDINMKALKYDYLNNAKKSIEAGCNLALYCKGNFAESKKLLTNMPYIDLFTKKKTSEFYKFLR